MQYWTQKNHNFLLENDIQLPKLYCKKAERGPYLKYKRKHGDGSVTNFLHNCHCMKYRHSSIQNRNFQMQNSWQH